MTKGLRITPVLLSPAEPGPVSGLYLGRPIPSSFFRSSETARCCSRPRNGRSTQLGFNAPLVEAQLTGRTVIYILGGWRLIMLIIRLLPEPIFMRMKI